VLTEDATSSIEPAFSRMAFIRTPRPRSLWRSLSPGRSIKLLRVIRERLP
jgi:hypothetical protein